MFLEAFKSSQFNIKVKETSEILQNVKAKSAILIENTKAPKLFCPEGSQDLLTKFIVIMFAPYGGPCFGWRHRQANIADATILSATALESADILSHGQTFRNYDIRRHLNGAVEL